MATPSLYDCSTAAGLAPASHDNQSCNSTCTFASGTLSCDLSSCGGASTGTVVTDYNSAGIADFSAWGDCNATAFCCAVRDDTSPSIDTVELHGSSYDDTLAFKYSTSDNLRPHRAATALDALISGLDGDDDIDGSRSGTSYLTEELKGGDGVDAISGWGGADLLDGGPGDDLQASGGGLWGGAGDDTILGGDGDDSLFGEDGDDVLHGGDGDDVLSGNDGSDQLFGESDSDQLFGGADADVLVGGDNFDTLAGQWDGDAHCDTAVDTTAACSGDTFDDGLAMTSNDYFWYEFDAFCAANGGQPVAFNARGGTDQCGDVAWNVNPTWPWSNCNGANLSVKPSMCP